VLAVICQLELFSQAHYRASIGIAPDLSALFKDVFLYHWREESQHAILDELEWISENARVSHAERDAAVDDMIAIVGGFDAVVQAQARADTEYFMRVIRGTQDAPRAVEVEAVVLKAYRWTYIVSGMFEPRFCQLLDAMTDDAQKARLQTAMSPLMYAVPASGAPQPAMAA
jgi:hypothetical protein